MGYRVQLKDRQQKATESMAELGQDIRRLANLAYPNAPAEVRETLAKEQFIDALVSSEMRLKIKQARPRDLNDAVRHAVELGAFYRAEKKQQGILRTAVDEGQSKDIENLKQVVSNLKHSVDSLKRQGQYNKIEDRSMNRQHSYDRRRVQQCKYRQTPYHRSNDDRSKRRYRHSNSGVTNSPPKYRKREFHYNFKPGSSGLRLEAGKNRDDRGFNKPSVRKSGLYATASIDRKSVDCLIDTGATLTLISDKLWSSIEHNHTLKEFDFQVSSTSGHYLKVKGQTELSILFGNNRYCRTTVIVAEIDMDVVLGLGFMRMHDVRIDIVHNKIEIRGQTFDMFCSGRIGCYQVGQSGQVDEPNKRRTRRRKRKVHTGSDNKVQNVDSLLNTGVCKI